MGPLKQMNTTKDDYWV